jgi:hypothetical protein
MKEIQQAVAEISTTPTSQSKSSNTNNNRSIAPTKEK